MRLGIVAYIVPFIFGVSPGAAVQRQASSISAAPSSPPSTALFSLAIGGSRLPLPPPRLDQTHHHDLFAGVAAHPLPSSAPISGSPPNLGGFVVRR